MSGTESIHDEYITQARHAPGQCFVITLLSTVESNILTKNNFTGQDFHAVQPVIFQSDFPAEQFSQAGSNGAQ